MPRCASVNGAQKKEWADSPAASSWPTLIHCVARKSACSSESMRLRRVTFWGKSGAYAITMKLLVQIPAHYTGSRRIAPIQYSYSTENSTKNSTLDLTISPSIPYLVGFWLSQLFGSQHECHAPRSLRLYYGCIFHGQELVMVIFFTVAEQVWCGVGVVAQVKSNVVAFFLHSNPHVDVGRRLRPWLRRGQVPNMKI